VEFAWNERKREANLAKHGLDFADAPEVFTDEAVIRDDPRHSEERYLLIGPLEGRTVVVAFTRRAGKVRVISMRKANERERRKYAQERLEAG